jgi:hypothetical protein
MEDTFLLVGVQRVDLSSLNSVNTNPEGTSWAILEWKHSRKVRLNKQVYMNEVLEYLQNYLEIKSDSLQKYNRQITQSTR